MSSPMSSLRNQSKGSNKTPEFITHLFVIPIMIEAYRFLLIYNPGFDFAHYILYTIKEKNSR